MSKIRNLFRKKRYRILELIEDRLVNKKDLELDIFNKENGYAIEMFLIKMSKYEKEFDNGEYMSLISEYDKKKSNIPLEVMLSGYSASYTPEDFEERYLVFRFSRIEPRVYKRILKDLKQEGNSICSK